MKVNEITNLETKKEPANCRLFLSLKHTISLYKYCEEYWFYRVIFEEDS